MKITAHMGEEYLLFGTEGTEASDEEMTWWQREIRSLKMETIEKEKPYTMMMRYERPIRVHLRHIGNELPRIRIPEYEECSCPCLACLEGNHCGAGVYEVVEEDGEVLVVGVCLEVPTDEENET